jgi:hypothetical protein
VLWHILCLPVAHNFKVFLCHAVAHIVPSRGTFCAFPVPVAHFAPSRGTWYSVPSCQELQVKNCKSRIASQELQVKNCKSRIASQELPKKSLLDIFFSRLNE